MISLLLIPLVTSIALVLIHVYFGSFVLKRGVIFIDLALAQWAALGYLVGHFLGVHNPYGLFFIGFSFTVIASILLTILRPYYKKSNFQEAVIGVMYIMAITFSTALVSVSGMEGYHINEMLAGHLLFIQPSELIIAICLYLVIGVSLFWLHPYLSRQVSAKWNFIFYVLFGLVVTSSVKMVGVLLVFSYLVLPLLFVHLFTKRLKNQLKWGWLVGIMAAFIGLMVSVVVDVPPSYCIILSLCTFWASAILFKAITAKLR